MPKAQGKAQGKRSAEGDAGGGSKHKKGKYLPMKEGLKSGIALPIGKQGIIVTLEGTGNPVRGGKEALMVFNEVYESLDPSSSSAGETAAGEAAGEEGPTDFSSLIASEVTDLKDKRTHRFRIHDTGIRNCIFVEMDVDPGKPGPVEVVEKMLRDAMETRRLQFRSCTRFLPCTHIFKCNDIDAIKTNAAKIVPELLNCTPEAEAESVAVLYEHRASPDYPRMQVIDAFVEHVPRPPHSVKLKGAAKTISVQVVRNACGVSVIKDYHDLQRCNIRSICDPPPKTTGETKAAADKTKDDAAPSAEADKDATAVAQAETVVADQPSTEDGGEGEKVAANETGS